MPAERNGKQGSSVAGSCTSSVSKSSSKSAISVSSKPKVMPASTAAGCQKSQAVKCAMCEQVVHGKDQALFCEGECQRWFYRYCAGVSVVHFHALCSSLEQFRCVRCIQKFYIAEIAILKESIRN